MQSMSSLLLNLCITPKAITPWLCRSLFRGPISGS